MSVGREGDRITRNVWRSRYGDVEGAGDEERAEEVDVAVGARPHERDLRARHDHTLGEVLQHQRQRGAGVGHRVRAVQNDEGIPVAVCLDDV